MFNKLFRQKNGKTNFETKISFDTTNKQKNEIKTYLKEEYGIKKENITIQQEEGEKMLKDKMKALLVKKEGESRKKSIENLVVFILILIITRKIKSHFWMTLLKGFPTIQQS